MQSYIGMLNRKDFKLFLELHFEEVFWKLAISSKLENSDLGYATFFNDYKKKIWIIYKLISVPKSSF